MSTSSVVNSDREPMCPCVQNQESISERLKANPEFPKCVATKDSSGVWRPIFVAHKKEGGLMGWGSPPALQRLTIVDSDARLERKRFHEVGNHLSKDECRTYAFLLVTKMLRADVSIDLPIARVALGFCIQEIVSGPEWIVFFMDGTNWTSLDERHRSLRILLYMLFTSYYGPKLDASLWTHTRVKKEGDTKRSELTSTSCSSSSSSSSSSLLSLSWLDALQTLFEYVARGYTADSSPSNDLKHVATTRQLSYHLLYLGFRLKTPLTSNADLFKGNYDLLRISEYLEYGCINAVNTGVGEIYRGTTAYAQEYQPFLALVQGYTDLKLCIVNVLLYHSALPLTLINLTGGYLPWWNNVKMSPLQRLFLQNVGTDRTHISHLETRILHLQLNTEMDRRHISQLETRIAHLEHSVTHFLTLFPLPPL